MSHSFFHHHSSNSTTSLVLPPLTVPLLPMPLSVDEATIITQESQDSTSQGAVTTSESHSPSTPSHLRWELPQGGPGNSSTEQSTSFSPDPKWVGPSSSDALSQVQNTLRQILGARSVTADSLQRAAARLNGALECGDYGTASWDDLSRRHLRASIPLIHRHAEEVMDFAVGNRLLSRVPSQSEARHRARTYKNRMVEYQKRYWIDAWEFEDKCSMLQEVRRSGTGGTSGEQLEGEVESRNRVLGERLRGIASDMWSEYNGFKEQKRMLKQLQEGSEQESGMEATV